MFRIKMGQNVDIITDSRNNSSRRRSSDRDRTRFVSDQNLFTCRKWQNDIRLENLPKLEILAAFNSRGLRVWQQALSPPLFHVPCSITETYHAGMNKQNPKTKFNQSIKREKERWLSDLVVDQIVEGDYTSDEGRKVDNEHHVVCFHCTKWIKLGEKECKRENNCANIKLQGKPEKALTNSLTFKLGSKLNTSCIFWKDYIMSWTILESKFDKYNFYS